jgi:serralysin
MATLTISATYDYSGDVLFNIGTFNFINGAGTTATATFDGNQFNNLNIKKAVAIDGSAGINIVEVDVGFGGFDASGWTFTHWTGADHLLLMGSAFGETLIGSARRDTILGDGGNDTIKGMGGADIIAGGIGADRMYGGGGQDTLSYEGSSSGVRVDLGLRTAFGGDALGDVFNGFERLTGSSHDDELTGSSANNWLTGGLGADELRGRGGADQFVYTSITESEVGAGHDLILDFSQAEGDRIRLNAIDAIVTGGIGGNDAFTFIGSGAFSTAGQIRSFIQGGNTYIQGNVDGNLAPDFEIVLAGVHTLTAGDFIL